MASPGTTLRLSDLSLQGARVLVRVDFNVPLDGDLRVTSDARIRAALPTLREILAEGGRPILISHLGRPKGQVVEAMRLRPAANRLQELLAGEGSKATVHYAEDCVGPIADAAVERLAPGDVLVLENLRFHPEETVGDAAFASALAKHGDCFVNDAFGTSHRAHASVSGVAEHLPAAAGRLLESEIAAFARILQDAQRPFVAILGGAKVSDKLPVILNLLDRVDTLILGGAMAYTFLAQEGIEVGTSRIEPDLFDDARRVRAAAAEQGVSLLLPTDHICAGEFAETADASTHGPAIPPGQMGLDIGPESIATFVAAIGEAKTILWNGPMGVFEWAKFRSGTDALARAVARAGESAFTVVGGGDSVAAAELLGVADRIGHVSTGGGASLELLEGKDLPGIAAVRG